MNLYEIKAQWGGICIQTFGTEKLLRFFERCALVNWEASEREEKARYSFRPRKHFSREK
jgi:hypothetical protein